MTTKSEKWPGTDVKWTADRKAQLKNRQRWYDVSGSLQKGELNHFANNGTFSREFAGVDWTKYKRWEWVLPIALGTFSLLREFEIEAHAEKERRFDYQAAARAYSAVRLSQMIDLHVHIKAQERIGSELSSMDIHLLPSTALGVIIGDPSALPLVRLIAAAARRGWYALDNRFPVYLFMLLLLADYLQEEMPSGTVALLGESPLALLLAEWNAPRPEAVVPLCLAACDFHTRRCISTAGMEFSSGQWRYTPVEIMLLMRLRSLRGLENPEFEHPLWTSAFSGVQAGVPALPDELIERIEQRMRADGYDEQFIIQGVLGA